MSRFTPEEQQSVLHLVERARHKDFLSDLVLHGYNHYEYSVSLFQVLRYLNGEPQGSELTKGVHTMFALIQRGIESHEVVGEGVIDELVALRRAREERDAARAALA